MSQLRFRDGFRHRRRFYLAVSASVAMAGLLAMGLVGPGEARGHCTAELESGCCSGNAGECKAWCCPACGDEGCQSCQPFGMENLLYCMGDPCDPEASAELRFAYDGLQRVTKIWRNGKELVGYDYQGDRMSKRSTRTEYADRAVPSSGARTVHLEYVPSYDDHGRITTISNVARASNSSGQTVGTPQNLAAFSYSYDDAGNRLSHWGARAGQATPNAVGHVKARQAGYDYDGLNRVTQASYTAPATPPTVFGYDMLGNRELVTDGLNSVTRSYASNLVNEYTKVAVGSQLPGNQNYFYDVCGNLSRDDGFDSVSGDSFVYSYDVENRLTQVQYDPGGGSLTAVAAYRYDALGRRIEYISSPPGGTATTTRYYYDGQNVIAEYTYNGSAETIARAYVNGTTYIDERVLMRDYVNCPTGKDHYYLHEELYSEAGLAAANGSLEEAYVYDTYGDAHIYRWPKGDFDRDGDIDDADLTYLSNNLSGSNTATDEPFLDLDADGDADGDENNLMVGPNAPVELASSGLGNPYLFTGRITDTLGSKTSGETTEYRRIQDNRNRFYDLKHARWIQTDPLGVRVDAPDGNVQPVMQYAAAMNTYEYDGSRPATIVDPDGLYGQDVHEGMTTTWAVAEGMKSGAARSVGSADIGTDGGWAMSGTGPMPYGEAGRHFDRNPSGADSRLRHMLTEYAVALRQCLVFDDPDGGAVHLGRSLHSLQDWWAHGGYWSAKGTPGLPSWFHGSGYDDINLDAVGTAFGVTAPGDGRPPQVYTSRKWWKLWQHDVVETSWPYPSHWKPNGQRKKRTEEQSREEIRAFLSTICTQCNNGKCPKCQCAFIDLNCGKWCVR